MREIRVDPAPWRVLSADGRHELSRREPDGRGHYRITGGLGPDEREKPPIQAAVFCSSTERSTLSEVCFRRCEKKRATGPSIDDVVSPAHDALLTEERQAVRALPGLTTVVREEEAGHSKVAVLHSDRHCEVGVIEADWRVKLGRLIRR